MEKLGPTQFEAEVAKLKAAGKLPPLEDILSAVNDAREKFRPQILEARDKGEDDAKDGE